MRIVNNRNSQTKIIPTKSSPNFIASVQLERVNERVVDPEAPIPVTTLDRNEIMYDSADVYTDFEVILQNVNLLDSCTLSIVDKSGAAISQVDGVSILTNNTSEIIAVELSSGGFKSVAEDAPLKTQGQNTKEFSNWVSGSLSAELESQASSLLNAQPNAVIGRPFFSSYDVVAGTATWNPDCAINNIAGKTAFAFWNQTGGRNRAGTAITKRHIVFSSHYQISTGHQVKFLDADNNIIIRTVVAKKAWNNLVSSSFSDYMIAVLDSDLPIGVTPLKCFPDNWKLYMPSMTNAAYDVPMFTFGQDKELVAREYYFMNTENYIARQYSNIDSNYYEKIRGGDSGSPNFAYLNGDFVLIGPHYSAFSGVFLTKGDIDQLISDVDALAGISTGYTATAADFSSYNSY